VRVSPGGAGGG